MIIYVHFQRVWCDILAYNMQGVVHSRIREAGTSTEREVVHGRDPTI